MGFFKDFKDDLSEEAKGLYDDDLDNQTKDDVMVNTLDDPELAKMAAELKKEAGGTVSDKAETKQHEQSSAPNAFSKKAASEKKAVVETYEEDEMDMDGEIADETAVITTGLTVKGDLDSVGSIDIFGVVEGNVTCRGKLTISGTIMGSSRANEVFANDAQIEGDIDAKGSVKIGQGTVIIGNLSATSAVIAGAVKGDIDVHGPVIVDTSAIIVGDIKSKTVQINNGATIDGRCSQCYADVNMDTVFDIKKKKAK